MPSGKFVPGSFSHENTRLKLEEGAWLGEEEMILFDEEDIRRNAEFEKILGFDTSPIAKMTIKSNPVKSDGCFY